MSAPRARGLRLWTLETEWKRVVTKLHRSAPRSTGACTARGGDASLELERGEGRGVSD
jgi:hypothetical protein